MVEKSLEDTIQDRINAITETGQPKDIDQYLESKLPLFSDLKQHFDSIPTLKPILTAYMSHDDQSDVAKRVYKERLVSAGVFQDEELLEFLLLIAEKPRNFDDKPTTVSEDGLGRYYFEKYCGPNEHWSSQTFRFSLAHTPSYRTDREKLIEEVAIKMVARSRASLAKAIVDVPTEISQLIQEADDYFQHAFHATFGRDAPISLTDVTHVTPDCTEHADRTSRNTFIQVDNFYRDRDKFVHLVIHEGMHLCFEGFYEKPIEEGLIEYFIEKMYENHPPTNFAYAPVSGGYTQWKQNFRSVFRVLPDSEEQFTQYFLTQDIDPLRIYLQEKLTDSVVADLKNDYYTLRQNNFLDSLRKVATNH